ncbi:MAG: hypothetical protein HY719_14145, partial [Planctomycetes bacterium]|nr:hypothetical protein [Planctomycetota bacterium]
DPDAPRRPRTAAEALAAAREEASRPGVLPEEQIVIYRDVASSFPQTAEAHAAMREIDRILKIVADQQQSADDHARLARLDTRLAESRARLAAHDLAGALSHFTEAAGDLRSVAVAPAFDRALAALEADVARAAAAQAAVAAAAIDSGAIFDAREIYRALAAVPEPTARSAGTAGLESVATLLAAEQGRRAERSRAAAATATAAAESAARLPAEAREALLRGGVAQCRKSVAAGRAAPGAPPELKSFIETTFERDLAWIDEVHAGLRAALVREQNALALADLRFARGGGEVQVTITAVGDGALTVRSGQQEQTVGFERLHADTIAAYAGRQVAQWTAVKVALYLFSFKDRADDARAYLRRWLDKAPAADRARFAPLREWKAAFDTYAAGRDLLLAVAELRSPAGSVERADRALTVAEKALGDLPVVLAARAELAERVGLHRQALDLWRRCQDLGPTAPALIGAARCEVALGERGNLVDALDALRAAEKLAPEAGEIFALRGRIYALQGLDDFARTAFRRALAIDRFDEASWQAIRELAPERPR